MPPLTRGDLVNLTFTVNGEKQLDRALGLYASAVKDMRPVWPDIRDDFTDGQEEQFSSQGQSGSGGWVSLSSDYGAWKALNFPGMPILQRTGRLKSSLTERSHADFRYEAGRMGLTMGTKVPYAGYHQTGTRKMPRRPPIELTEAQRRGWVKMIHAYIVESGQAQTAIGTVL